MRLNGAKLDSVGMIQNHDLMSYFLKYLTFYLHLSQDKHSKAVKVSSLRNHTVGIS